MKEKRGFQTFYGKRTYDTEYRDSTINWELAPNQNSEADLGFGFKKSQRKKLRSFIYYVMT